jgi:hypothetical protein
MSATEPADGDVIITTIDERHHVSIFPHPSRLTFGDIARAHQIARMWAKAQRAKSVHVAIWRWEGQRLFKLPPDEDRKDEDRKEGGAA